MQLLLFAMCLVAANADRFQDYQKFPNRRYGEPSRGSYDYDRRNELYNSNSGNNYNNNGHNYNNNGNNYNNYDNYENNNKAYCTNRVGQSDIQMEHIMGMWYGVEFIPHLVGNPGIYRGDTCIVVHIAETWDEPSTQQTPYHVAVFNSNLNREYRHLRLLWDEDGRDVEYSLYFKNDSVGYWNTFGDQNGTMSRNPNYKHFTGSVQVMKAVGDHLLLHFCQAQSSGNQAQLFSILLSREPRQLQKWEVESAHALLRRKHLSVTTRRLVCGNTGSELQATISLIIMICAFMNKSMLCFD